MADDAFRAGPAAAAEIAGPPLQAWWRTLLKHRSILIGAVIVAAIVIPGILAPLVTHFPPNEMHIRDRFTPPSAEYWMGTDAYGRDVYARVVHGARISMGIAALVTIAVGAFGAVLGVLSGYYRKVDATVMRVMDALMAFPEILLAIAITAALGPQLNSVVIAIAVAYVPRTVRIVRASALLVRELAFVEAALINGAGDLRILFRHVLPNCIGPLAVQLTFVFAYAILAEAALSFIGVGPPPPAPSWGNVISDARDYAAEAWWVMVFPGLAISLAALGTNLLGDGLSDLLDPRMKGNT